MTRLKQCNKENRVGQNVNQTLITIFFLLLLSGCRLFPSLPYSNEESITRTLELMKSTVWKSNHPMLLGITLDSVSYHYPGHYYGSIDEDGGMKEIDAAFALCVDYIRIDLRNEVFSFPDELEKLDRIVSYIREKGMSVYISAYGMETWMPSWQIMFANPEGGVGKASWEEFQEVYIEQVQKVTERYKPDYIGIIPEAPLNIGNQVNTRRNLEEWVGFTNQVAIVAKQIKPDIQVIVNVIARDDMQTLQFAELLAANSEEVDILGIDPYSRDEFSSEFTNIQRLAQLNNWDGEIWVAETNLLHPIDDEDQADYLYKAYQQAERMGFGGFTVFYFRDIPKISDDRGILSQEFSAQPAYRVLQELRNCNNEH